MNITTRPNCREGDREKPNKNLLYAMKRLSGKKGIDSNRWPWGRLASREKEHKGRRNSQKRPSPGKNG